MYPTEDDPAYGEFVRSQMDSVAALGHAVTVEVIDGRASSVNYARAARRLPAVARSLGVDVVHAHYGLSGAAAVSVRAPLVVSYCGDDLFGTSDGRGGVTVRSRVGIALSWLAAWRADAIICKSEALRGALPALLRERCPVHIVPNGVDLELFHPGDRAAARVALGLDPTERLVFFPHSTRQRAVKRFDLAEAAVARLSADGVPARLWIVNGVPQAELPRYYHAADCLLLTSDHEGSPNTVKEALCCDLPVVTVPAGDAAEQVQDVPGCAVVAREVTAIAAGLRRTLQEVPRVDGAPARRRLGLPAIATRLVAAYEDAVARWRAR
jgi:glycosyltransferase involved in cell wall biosynthesis